jgi:hypothetical protein
MKIYIMALEPLETRYTGQWFNGFPMLIAEDALSRGIDDVEVINVAGEQVSFEPTPGAFLDFGGTNIWKNTQINELARAFATGEVEAGDKVIFTDAWHTGILQVKYMSELLNVPVEIHSMWHAGSYDPQDFLGRLIKDKRWTYSTERALFYASTYNYFATEFHRDMFLNTLFMGKPLERGEAHGRCVISGQPHNVLIESLKPYKGMKKKRQVVFPHRIAPEKQVEIFRDLAFNMPDVDFVVCQDQKLTKHEYHQLLGESMIVFSANLQETLGISAMEGILVGAFPFVPDRLSYKEMYLPDFKYPSEWTTSFAAYEQHRETLITELYLVLDNFVALQDAVVDQEDILLDQYLMPWPMLDRLFNAA